MGKDNRNLSNSYHNLIHPVYQALKTMIETGELQPGEKIRQEKIASKLGVSRTPLVKALQILEQECLVENSPRRGMFVSKINSKDLINAFICRLAIETTAVMQAGKLMDEHQVEELRSLFNQFDVNTKIDNSEYLKADQLFHQKLIEYSQNKFLVKMASIANIQFLTYQHGLIRPPQETLPEHHAMIDALRIRDIEMAQLLMKLHIQKSIALLVDKMD